MGLHALHHMNWVDEWVVAHMKGHEGLYGQVGDPAMQLVAISGDKASIFTVQGMGDGESITTPAETVGYIWEINSIAEEEGIHTHLNHQFGNVHH